MARYHASVATRSRTRPTPAPSRDRSSLALIAHLAQVVRRDADQALADVDGMRPRHLVALTLLRDHGPMAQAALGEAVRLDPSNVVALLNDLEARGLVARRRDPEDRRRHIVELSEGGGRALDRAEDGLSAVEDRILGTLSADERRTLHGLLLRASGDRLPDCTEAAAPEDEPAC
jgi:DNA-binding MarR family transcriptional regulator